jgi:glyoxylate reductase
MIATGEKVPFRSLRLSAKVSKHCRQGRTMNVLVTGRLPDDVLALIKKEHNVEINLQDMPMDRERIISKIIDKDGILCMITDKIDKELLDKAQHLKIIANFGVGFDNIDVQAATERGILVTNTPGILTDATADMTFALILASYKGWKIQILGSFAVPGS